jgi:hypothetical protein
MGGFNGPRKGPITLHIHLPYFNFYNIDFAKSISDAGHAAILPIPPNPVRCRRRRFALRLPGSFALRGFPRGTASSISLVIVMPSLQTVGFPHFFLDENALGFGPEGDAHSVRECRSTAEHLLSAADRNNNLFVAISHSLPGSRMLRGNRWLCQYPTFQPGSAASGVGGQWRRSRRVPM